jgi:gentisate 1,2-dioxygenase
VTDDFGSLVAQASSLNELYPIINDHCFTAGWHKKRPSLWSAPQSELQPMHWRYRDGKQVLDRAGEWIGTDLAERRNLIMFNPVGDNDYASVRTLITAYQMIKPGEYAKTHRHTPNALRLILEADPGVYTVVDGVKIAMTPGAVAYTPGWTWHSHYNEGTANAYWIDFLDVPLVHLLEPMFYEQHPDEYQPITGEAAQSDWAFSAEWVANQLAEQAELAPGVRRLSLPNPQMVTMELRFLSMVEGGVARLGRSTASSIFAIAGGSGTATIGEQRFAWERGDVLACPSWTPAELEAHDDALIFEVSDEPTLRRLGFYRAEE